MVEVKLDEPQATCPECGFWKSPNNHQCPPRWEWWFTAGGNSRFHVYAHTVDDALRGALRKWGGVPALPKDAIVVCLSIKPETRVDCERMHEPPEAPPRKYAIRITLEPAYEIKQEEP